MSPFDSAKSLSLDPKIDTQPPNRQSYSPDPTTQATPSTHQSITNISKATRSSSLKRTLSRASLIRRPSRRTISESTSYTEPRFTVSGNIKSLRFDDYPEDGEAPTTNWAEAQGKTALRVARDPTLPPLEPRRASWTPSFLTPYPGQRKLAKRASRSMTLPSHSPGDVHPVASGTWAASQDPSGRATESREDGKSA